MNHEGWAAARHSRTCWACLLPVGASRRSSPRRFAKSLKPGTTTRRSFQWQRAFRRSMGTVFVSEHEPRFQHPRLFTLSLKLSQNGFTLGHAKKFQSTVFNPFLPLLRSCCPELVSGLLIHPAPLKLLSSSRLIDFMTRKNSTIREGPSSIHQGLIGCARWHRPTAIPTSKIWKISVALFQVALCLANCSKQRMNACVLLCKHDINAFATKHERVKRPPLSATFFCTLRQSSSDSTLCAFKSRLISTWRHCCSM